MIISESSLDDLFAAFPQLRPQMYFKSSLIALSHAMEDQVLAGEAGALVIASFQRERFYRQEARRYQRIAAKTDQVYVLAVPETDFANRLESYATIAFEPGDALAQEWHLVVIGKRYAACLLCRERRLAPIPGDLHVDQARRFEGLWTFDRPVVLKAAELLLQRIVTYRPDLAAQVTQGLTKVHAEAKSRAVQADPEPFAERLVTYLQAGQYKLAKAYRAIAEKERKERLVNSITTAVRQSLQPDEILQAAAQELGLALAAERCLIYRCKQTDPAAELQYEYLDRSLAVAGGGPPASLVGQAWDLQHNPVFQGVIDSQAPIYIGDTQAESRFDSAQLAAWADRGQFRSGLMVPVLHQDRLLGVVELHYRDANRELARHQWDLATAIADQIGIALIQAEAYASLADLNQQLAALDRTRSNLIAITGHELRTPLSTVQICLESLASEPDMAVDMRQVMLNSALSDADRMRKLIQDFLTLSRLESGRVQWRCEPVQIQECLDLALSSLQTRYGGDLPSLEVMLPEPLPWVNVDGEWLVEVLVKLLDNACKFTESVGMIRVSAQPLVSDLPLVTGPQMLELVVADTGRGIEPNRLETVFERFYQEEGALRRSAGGTGLGLAICRQVVAGWGGQIWAVSGGQGQGSAFHLTLPIAAAMVASVQGGTARRSDAGASSGAWSGASSGASSGALLEGSIGDQQVLKPSAQKPAGRRKRA